MLGGLPTEVGCVFLGEFRPLLWQIIESKNRRNGANRNASTTIDAFYGIDVEHLFTFELFGVLFGVDAIYGAGVNACRVFRPNARFCNYVSHVFTRLA